MPQGQPCGGSWGTPVQLAASLVFGLAQSKRSLIAGCGGQARVPGQGGWQLQAAVRGLGVSHGDGQAVLVTESQPAEGAGLARSWAAAPCGFSLLWVQPLLLQPVPFAVKGLQQGPSCNEFDCCFRTINSFNPFLFPF